jgi:hypothetical protein
MSKIDRIEADIEITKAEIADAKRSEKSEAYLISLQNTLTKQTGVWEKLLAIQEGKFQLLSLHMSLSNLIPSSFISDALRSVLSNLTSLRWRRGFVWSQEN